MLLVKGKRPLLTPVLRFSLEGMMVRSTQDVWRGESGRFGRANFEEAAAT